MGFSDESEGELKPQDRDLQLYLAYCRGEKKKP